MKSKRLIRTAQCLCGGVKIKVFGKLRYVINCHCVQCMKTHGNYATYTSSKKDNIKFMNQKTLQWYKSSSNARRGFCNICGASIFFHRTDNQYISISAGMFSNPTKLKTKIHIFTKGKSDYYVLDNSLPKYHRYP